MKLPWKVAIVARGPDEQDAATPLFGMTRRDRLQRTLLAGGIEDVVLSGTGRGSVGPCLMVRAGAMLDSGLLSWFATQLDDRGCGVLLPRNDHSRPILLSLPAGVELAPDADFDTTAAALTCPRLHAPEGRVCLYVPDGEHPGYGHGLWRLTSKSRERWHLRGVRRSLFPLTATLAAHGLRPSTVTWVSFWVALLGCILVAFGGYWGSVAGAVCLYISWILDCLDGALSRLTFQASAAGAKLDTDLGRIAYGLTAASVAWAAYGRIGAWKDFLPPAAAFTVGALLSIVAGLRADRLPAASRPPGWWRVRMALEHGLHRDNTLVLLVCALADRLTVFLWLLIVALNLSWIVDTMVLLTARRPAGLSDPLLVPPGRARSGAPE